MVESQPHSICRGAAGGKPLGREGAIGLLAQKENPCGQMRTCERQIGCVMGWDCAEPVVARVDFILNGNQLKLLSRALL